MCAAPAADGGARTKESCRAAAAKTREATGVKGRALFHPIRVAMTGWESGPELDLALPAIDRVAGLLPGVPGCPARARRLADSRAGSSVFSERRASWVSSRLDNEALRHGLL